MSERGQGPYDTIAGKWLALIERRQENFIELCETGRWRHYYTKAEFLEEMRKVLRLRDQWASVAGLPPQSDDRSILGNVLTLHRVLPNRLVPLNLTSDDAPGGEADLPPKNLPPEKMQVNELPAMHWPD
jgi:uncharacterized repeat protein (TIGR03809 family)